MTPAEIPLWVQGGGLLAFAGLVWWEIRQLRPTLRDVRDLLIEIRTAGGLSYEHTPPQGRRRVQTPPVGTFRRSPRDTPGGDDGPL